METKQEILKMSTDEYTMLCCKCYEAKPLEVIPHRATGDKNGIVGMVFSCKDCKDIVYGSSVTIDYDDKLTP